MEFREYERASTTAIAALVQPVLAAYVERLESWLSRRSFAGRFSLMQSNGDGPRRGTAREPGRRAFLGSRRRRDGRDPQSQSCPIPRHHHRRHGRHLCRCCLAQDGRAELAAQTTVGGLPVRTPLFDIVVSARAAVA